MLKNKLISSFVMALAMVTTSVHAVNFNAFDPKSIAMGGAGVAIADPATAPFFNPALLSIAETDDDFSVEVPILGFRISDQNDFIDKVDGTDLLVDDLDRAINNYNVDPAGNSVLPVTQAMDDLNGKLFSLSDSPVVGDGGLGMVVAIPSDDFGLAFSASATVSGVGFFTYRDGQTVTDFTADVTTLDSCLPTCSPLDFNNLNNVDLVNGEISFNTDQDIESEARFIGIGVSEAGLSISHEFFFGNTNISLGVTPKIVSISIINYTANASNIEDEIDNFDENTADYDDFNLDFGAAMDFENNWRGGVTVKNLISQEYESAESPDTPSISIKLEPQIRVGVSHQNDWSTVAVDLDITENETLGLLDASTQYAAFGIEINAWEIAQLRAGYRADLVNSNRDVLSLGFGLSPFGVHLDIGLAVGEGDNEAGFALQFGFRI